ncbi:hypothetical protein BER93_10825 [Xanthomonas fragariae]|nr:hypothetical protein BER92_10805 [Xanthomonas fragariae]AOD18542.1 hypothetical protein BER93_10825 [Xanthomonas fragariae]
MSIPIPLHEVFAFGVETTGVGFGGIAVIVRTAVFERLHKGAPLNRIDKEGFDRGVLLGEVGMFGVGV